LQSEWRHHAEIDFFSQQEASFRPLIEKIEDGLYLDLVESATTCLPGFS